MIKFLQDAKILIFTLIVMTVMTGLSYIDMNAEKGISLPVSEIIKATPVAVEFKRTPAALPDKKTEIMKADIFCATHSPARFKKVVQPLVMLSLNVCEPLKSARHIWVKNETNGFKAQIFKTAEKNFRTDFIQLNPGTNKVTVETVLKDGQKRVQSLEIISGS